LPLPLTQLSSLLTGLFFYLKIKIKIFLILILSSPLFSTVRNIGRHFASISPLLAVYGVPLAFEFPRQRACRCQRRPTEASSPIGMPPLGQVQQRAQAQWPEVHCLKWKCHLNINTSLNWHFFAIFP
jgi:hypothetical protein